MKALPLSEKIYQIKPGQPVFIPDPNFERFLVKSLKRLNHNVVLSLEGIEDVESASKFRNFLIYIEEGAIELGDGEYLVEHVIGLSVVSETGVPLGRVAEIFPTGNSDVYVIREGEKEFLIPAVKEFVKKIDLERRTMVVHVVEGLLD